MLTAPQVLSGADVVRHQSLASLLDNSGVTFEEAVQILHQDTLAVSMSALLGPLNEGVSTDVSSDVKAQSNRSTVASSTKPTQSPCLPEGCGASAGDAHDPNVACLS